MNESPRVGQIITENDPRNYGTSAKKIVDIDSTHAICRSGWDGTGRKSRVRLDRLASDRYSLLRNFG